MSLLTLRQYYETLELPVTAGRTEVRQSFKDLLRVWHPDRFGDDPRLRLKAETKTREIICAYEGIMTKIVEAERRASEKPPVHDSITPHFQDEYAARRSSQAKACATKPAHLRDRDWSEAPGNQRRIGTRLRDFARQVLGFSPELFRR